MPTIANKTHQIEPRKPEFVFDCRLLNRDQSKSEIALLVLVVVVKLFSPSSHLDRFFACLLEEVV